jgi:glyoxylase-like metal-dependent hydrolase (beta-lactamase superfamily II)
VTGPEFQALDEVVYGRVEQVTPMIRRVVAENPSKFTYRGTGTYLVGRGRVAVVDPGPELDSHRDALAAALDGERVTAICVTHCHNDHSPLAAWLRSETGAPTIAFGPHPPADPNDDDDELAEEIAEGVKVEEAVDLAFEPDVRVVDGDVAARGPGWTVTAVHTPGHTSNHTCFAFAEERVLFPGDHVMGWSTTVVSPPDGDMAAYVDSLRKVAGRADQTYWPTHGPCIAEPQRYVESLVAHRLERERQIVDAVGAGVVEIPEIVARLYADVAAELHKAAGRTVLAHLGKLVDDGAVCVAGGGPPRLASRYELA